jgi:hypothetical protein
MSTLSRSTLATFAVTMAAIGAGCAHQWESVLDGNLYTRVNVNRYPVSIVAIDGEYSTINPRRIDAGVRRLTIDAPPVANFALPARKEFTFTVEKCVRYWLAAQRANALTQDFELVIDHAEPVPGCTPYGVPHEKSVVRPADIAAPTAIPVPKRP